MAGFVVKFKTRLVEPVAKRVNCSREVYKLYDLQYDNNHKIKIVETGEVNVNDRIQSYANDTDFMSILKTIEVTENPWMYAYKNEQAVDLRDVPTSLSDVKALANELKSKEKIISESEYFASKGLSFEEFIKNYSALEHAQFLNNKYNKKGDEN